MNHSSESSARSDPFGEAWRAHHDRLVARAARMVTDKGSAEDLVQEAYRRLSAGAVEGGDDVGGGVAVVVRRLGVNQLRGAFFRHEVAGDGTTGAGGRVPP